MEKQHTYLIRSQATKGAFLHWRNGCYMLIMGHEGAAVFDLESAKNCIEHINSVIDQLEPVNINEIDTGAIIDEGKEPRWPHN